MTVLAVVGAGSMGAQIAQQAALHGIEVRLQDVSAEQLARGPASNRALLQRRVDKGRLAPEELEAALDRVRTTTDMGDAVSGADAVIEAVVERLEVKREVFAALDRLAPPGALLASNSSTMFVSEVVAGVVQRPERCCNMHFFYPPLVMDLVEVVQGAETSDRAAERAVALAREIGRTPVLLRKEIHGFIVNRILHMATQEAYRLLDAGVAGFEDIDTAVEKGLNWPLGPFRLGDLTGLDVTYNARRHIYEATGDERYRPSPSLRAKVAAGELGRKTGRGWYEYGGRA
ncbi:MAG: 3-hydroxyacyl-CoA dehydrogenase family protein [Candidatus Dormibacteraeota bacterium]|nr:3-hydroxyacyl-CoA dehydrogenase family protein [Candidatus Dormibacteraeota bacterium]